MKRLILYLTLPLTIIIMVAFTKWNLVLPVDGTQTRMWGFPFSFAADAWHTSLSYQIFITEFIIDFFFHFSSLTLIFFLINKYLITIKIPKLLTRILGILSISIVILAIFIAAMPEQIIQIKRNWEIETLLDSGYAFFWENAPQRH